MPRLLYVEDNEMNRDMLSRRLQRRGFEVLIAGDGEQGVTVAAAEMLLIPFLQVISASERDPELPRKLKTEWPAILRWIIDGCLAFQREGLNPPASALVATQQYLESEDVLGQWLEERCIVDPRAGWAPLTGLFVDWQEWTGPRGHRAGTVKFFGKMLDERGLHRRKTMHGQGFDGIKLFAEAAAGCYGRAGWA